MEEDLIVLRFENSQLFEMRHRTKQINVLLPGLVVLVPMWAIRMGGIHDVLRCSNAVRSETGAHQRFWARRPRPSMEHSAALLVLAL